MTAARVGLAAANDSIAVADEINFVFLCGFVVLHFVLLPMTALQSRIVFMCGFVVLHLAMWQQLALGLQLPMTDKVYLVFCAFLLFCIFCCDSSLRCANERIAAADKVYIVFLWLAAASTAPAEKIVLSHLWVSASAAC